MKEQVSKLKDRGLKAVSEPQVDMPVSSYRCCIGILLRLCICKVKQYSLASSIVIARNNALKNFVFPHNVALCRAKLLSIVIQNIDQGSCLVSTRSAANVGLEKWVQTFPDDVLYLLAVCLFFPSLCHYTVDSYQTSRRTFHKRHRRVWGILMRSLR